LERIPRQLYTQEFKVKAVSLVKDGGLIVAEVSRPCACPSYGFRKQCNRAERDVRHAPLGKQRR